MVTNHLILAALWILYCVLHSVLASVSIKHKARHWMGKSYKHYRLFYTLFAFAGLIAILLFQINIRPVYLFNQGVITYIVGCFIALAGLIIMGICISKYFVSLSGIKSLVQESPSNQLIITGVHRYVRHPLYLGTFLFIWGLLLLWPLWSLLITNSIITIYTLAAIKLEEDKLIDEFGESYRQYQSSVSKIFPSFKRNPTV